MPPVIRPLVPQFSELLPDLEVASVQLSLQVHGQTLVSVACRLQRSADLAHLHVSVLFYLGTVAESLQLSFLVCIGHDDVDDAPLQ